MDNALTSPQLQYGAFFVLLVVIAALFFIQRERDKKAAERQVVLDEKAFAEQETNAEFVRGLVNKALETQDAQAGAWREMAAEFVTVQRELARSLKEIGDQMQKHGIEHLRYEQQAEQRHRELMTGIEQH